jgi:hypothetical protein
MKSSTSTRIALRLRISVDHVILDYDPTLDTLLERVVPSGLRERQAITLELAEEFLRRHRVRKCRFTPMGVAQGWSPDSFAYAVSALQRMGYRRIALGGMVPLRTPDIRAVVERAGGLRASQTAFHLLGVTRIDHIEEFARYGVASFDSTSPLRRAFKDDKDNYFTLDRAYTAIRVPQVDGNTKLKRSIVAGQVDQAAARTLERRCLDALSRYDREQAELDEVLEVLRAYDLVHDGRADRTEAYREALTDRPWRACTCEVCRALGIHVIVFRGAERNRRRGLHNVYTVYQRLHRELGRTTAPVPAVAKASASPKPAKSARSN